MTREILDTLTYIANAASETVIYGNIWSAKFCHKEICEKLNKAAEFLKKHLNWDSLTVQDCKELRFSRWEKDSPLYLIPIWLYKAIPIGTKLTSIGGDEIVFDGSNIDTDTRCGCIAWGIIPKSN